MWCRAEPGDTFIGDRPCHGYGRSDFNHDGDFSKAVKMVHDAHNAGCEILKFQCHIIHDEMLVNNVIPPNATESIYDMMVRCSFSEEQEIKLKQLTESLGMIYLSTPFSRMAVDRLDKIGVPAFKIGSGECNNYPLIEHIAKKGKPIILSTGMNNIDSIRKAVDIIESHSVDYSLLHCTSMYPTPYDKVRLGALAHLQREFTKCSAFGLSDHSLGNYTCFASIPLGARILEKHFTSDKSWKGSDVPISIDPTELKDLIQGSNAIFKALGGDKNILKEEQGVIDFAYASVVSIKDIQEGEVLSIKNIWVKRPATGEIKADEFDKIIGRTSKQFIENNTQIKYSQLN